MPSLQALDLVRNPSHEPLTYPGPLVKQSCLLIDSWVYPIIVPHMSKSGDWQVKADGGPLDISSSMRLNETLNAANVAPMSEREPMLTIGSNASPGQLLHKFGADAVVPMTRVTVSGCTIGHSPHVSKPGYIPYIAVAAPDIRRDFIIAWLDENERQVMDATEPNYTRVVVDGGKVPAVLESGEHFNSYALYRGRWGALRIQPDQPPTVGTSQSNLLSALAKYDWFRQLLPASALDHGRTAKALAENANLRDAVRGELRRRNLVTDDGLDKVLLAATTR